MSHGSGPVAVVNSVLVSLLAIGMMAVAIVLGRESAVVIRFGQSIVTGLQAMPTLEIQEMAISVAGCGIVILLIELWPRHGVAHFVSQIDGGTIEYSAALVADLIECDLAGQDGVQSARVCVSGQRQQVSVTASIASVSDADPQLIASRAASRIRDRVSGLGISLGRMHVSIETAKTGSMSSSSHARVAA
ncbi:MAG TPA: hypothetical protein VMW65_08820 [Chloroflexota bacterium]|nr:hypothetical protein [Chloroflexota bacterium]